MYWCGLAGCGSAESEPAVAITNGCGSVLSATRYAVWECNASNAVCSLHVNVHKYLPRGRFSILPGSRMVLWFSFVGACRCGWAGCGSAESKPDVAITHGCGSVLSATRYAVWQQWQCNASNAVCSLHVIVRIRFDSV